MLQVWSLSASLVLRDIISEAKLVTPLQKIIPPLREVSCLDREPVEENISLHLLREKCSESLFSLLVFCRSWQKMRPVLLLWV